MMSGTKVDKPKTESSKSGISGSASGCSVNFVSTWTTSRTFHQTSRYDTASSCTTDVQYSCMQLQQVTERYCIVWTSAHQSGMTAAIPAVELYDTSLLDLCQLEIEYEKIASVHNPVPFCRISNCPTWSAMRCCHPSHWLSSSVPRSQTKRFQQSIVFFAEFFFSAADVNCCSS